MSTAESKAVFLSYASQDVAAALRLCTALRAAGVVPIDLTGLGGDADVVRVQRHGTVQRGQQLLE